MKSALSIWKAMCAKYKKTSVVGMHGLMKATKYLRELSQEQIKQNGQILNGVLSGNQEAAKRQDEIKTAAAKTRADLWLKAIGSGGVFYLIVDMIMKLLK